RFTRLQARSTLTPETEAGFRAEIETISKEYEQIEDTLRRTSSRYTALSQPKPLTVSEIQSRIVAPDTVLLEYFLGEGRSFVWVVTPDSLTTVQLPKKAEIERLARQAYDLMAETGDTNRTIRLDSIQSEQTQVALNEALSKLSRIILEPVASHLGNKRLLIVPDGVLHFIPFAALPVGNAQSKPEPLLTSHELVVLPSASALDVLRTETLNRPKPTKELAVVADPVFEPTDGRLPKQVALSATALSTDQKLDRNRQLRLEKTKSSIQEVGIADEANQIPRLPGTRREAESILKLVPKTKAAHAFDFTASRSFFDRPDLDQFRLLHIATHGFINSERPEFSGLIFSMFDQQGKTQNGFLLLPDVFNLKLNTDLVTLSACQSGLGKEIKGEGMVGLTQGFLYAGTSRVLVSLW
ncbi:MAG TPA: CHAT domain-containing protein, partial [Acidobacteriota bacterium]|nr:CHAT domain-containing protein [Acidobacteriota bacterium]